MTIRYTTSLEGITADMLPGFFEGWPAPPSPEKHLRILRGSRHVVLAVDDEANRVVGFVSAISDGQNSAFIPLLEVVPNCRGQGIGSELMKRMLAQLRDYPCIDLVCDEALKGFYARLGMQQLVGMALRNQTGTAPGVEDSV
jgi:ribosomal protein S18 acetylase RimI-like enzyme